jgi:hypothetical protein
MKYDELLRRAAGLGYKGATEKGRTDPNRTLAEVAISRDTRLWAAFPAMLANAGEEGEFKPEAALAHLQGHEKEYFKALMLTSTALYGHLRLRFGWAKPAIAGYSRGALNEYIVAFRDNLPIKIGPETLTPGELRAAFAAGYSRREQELRSAAAARELVSLEYALSRIFPPRQKQLFLRKLKGEPLGKTEREYYSRVIKKKVQALANADLHRMAVKALE